jgi:hypothetical protein
LRVDACAGCGRRSNAKQATLWDSFLQHGHVWQARFYFTKNPCCHPPKAHMSRAPAAV